jgi:hypothetical protein
VAHASPHPAIGAPGYGRRDVDRLLGRRDSLEPDFVDVSENVLRVAIL